MSASRIERTSTKDAVADYDTQLTATGHRMSWKLGDSATRKGHAYFWHGVCLHCAAEITVGSTWTSCPGIRDARHTPCSGPGTSILTEIEADRASELFAKAIAEYGRRVTY